jgi:hypothetical protein
MKPLYETIHDRLVRVGSQSAPFTSEIDGPRYLIAIALIAGILSVLAVVAVGGHAMADFARMYARWLKDLASPFAI